MFNESFFICTESDRPHSLEKSSVKKKKTRKTIELADEEQDKTSEANDDGTTTTPGKEAQGLEADGQDPRSLDEGSTESSDKKKGKTKVVEKGMFNSEIFSSISSTDKCEAFVKVND